MNTYRLIFLGFGNVGRELARMLLNKTAELEERYSITWTVTGIATAHHGMAVNPTGIDLESALALANAGKSLSALSRSSPVDVLDCIRLSGGNVLFENTPVNHQNGQPAIDYIRTALELGMHVCTANKGAVVHGYRELRDLARKMGVQFFFETTVMDGVPIFSLFREIVPCLRLLSFTGILNSTTNIILSRMEAGESFVDALRYCQQMGFTETNSSADIDGWDAAVKVAALVTVLMDTPYTPQQVARIGISGITEEMVRSKLNEGMRYKLICSAAREGNAVVARVSPETVSDSSPLYHLQGSTSYIQFSTDLLGDLAIMELNPGPRTTAYGLLADFINAIRTG